MSSQTLSKLPSSVRRLQSAEETGSTVAAERKLSQQIKKNTSHLSNSPSISETLKESLKVNAESKLTFKVFRYAQFSDKILIFIGLFMNLLNGACMPAFMLIFGDTLNAFGGAPTGGRDINYFVLFQVYIGIFSLVVSSVGIAAIDWAAERQIKRIRHHYLEAVIQQEMGWFDMFDPGTLASRLNQNCTTIRDGIGMKLGQLCMFCAMFVGGYVVGFIRGWKLTLVMTAALPALALAGFFFMYFLGSAEKQSREAYAQGGSVVEEVLSNIRTVLAFGAEQKSLLRYEVHLAESFKAGVRGGVFFGLGMGATMCVMFLSYALGFWYSGQLVANDLDRGCVENCFYGGNALTVFFSVLIAAMSIGQAGPPLSALMRASASMKDITELVDRESAINPFSPIGQKNLALKGDIVFRNVSFCYPARPDVKTFNQLDLHIPAGQTVALVGPSGCGKSTAIQLIQRFYDPLGGTILLDNMPLHEYNLSWLRDQMSLVNQEPRLFARSIRENIRDGRLDASDAEVEDAAVKANAYEFIAKFPNGFDTYVGEGGSQLSGGQKQRIAIARAILRDPAILILDEATSALDNESEKVVQETLDTLIAARSRTTIVIAHRLSTIRNADKILVFSDSDRGGGVVVEAGSHDELIIKEDGVYRRLVEGQRLQTEVAERLESKMSLHAASLSNAYPRYTKKPSIVMNTEEHQQRDDGTSAQILKTASSTAAEAKRQNEKNVALPYSKPPSYWRILKLLRRYWFLVTLGILASIIAGLVFPAFAIIFSEFIGVYFKQNPDEIRSDCNFWALMFVVIAVAAFMAVTSQKTLMEVTGQRLVRELRSKTFEQMLYQDIVFFDDPRHSTGTLSQVLSSDVLLVKGWSGDNLGIITQNAASLVAALVIAFVANAKLAAVSLAAFLTVIPAATLKMKFMQGGSKEVEASGETAGYFIYETVTNMRIVTAYNLQRRMLKYYDDVLESEFSVGRKNAILGGFFFGISQFLQYGALALTLWYAGTLMKNNETHDVAAIMRAIFALLMASMGVGQSMVFVTDVKKAQEGAGRVFEVIDRNPAIDVRSQEGLKPLHYEIQGNVSFTNIAFRYPQRSETPVFKELSFDAKSGQTIAIVGESGCGKSTIIQLLERFYDIQPQILLSRETGEVFTEMGKITLDNHDIREINVAALRGLMGLVSQEPVLFNTSIKENIRYGRPGVTDDEVIAAARQANAHTFISGFPDQYETIAGKFGSQLSGGQKQRIAIARAILRNPKILLLDEATSALDAESEKVVQEALDKLLAETKRTTFIVAHRLSTIQNADKIIVLSNEGRQGSIVVESGTHKELMDIPNGVYWNLVQSASSRKKKTDERSSEKTLTEV